MNENDFELLCESIRQAGEIRRGVRKPSRTFVIEDPNPKAIRERLGLSQSRFASIIGVSVRTLQNWEQGRREPEGYLRRLYFVSWIESPRLYYTHSTQAKIQKANESVSAIGSRSDASSSRNEEATR
jgi:putative transcriptional regulator